MTPAADKPKSMRALSRDLKDMTGYVEPRERAPKRCWIEWQADFTPSALTYWVHRNQDAWTPWRSSSAIEPPLPTPLPGRGYPRLRVEVAGCVFDFASFDELDHCIETFGRKRLPETAALVADYSRAREDGDPILTDHWLDRLPRRAYKRRVFKEALDYLVSAREALSHEVEMARRAAATKAEK